MTFYGISRSVNEELVYCNSVAQLWLHLKYQILEQVAVMTQTM